MLDLLATVRGTCRAQPTAVAVESAAHRLSYGALDAHADALASLLRADAPSAGARVAVLVGDRVSLVPAMLGVVRAGCAYVPLEVDAPDERLMRALARVRPAAIVVDRTVRARAEGLVKAAELACRFLDAPDPDDAPAEVLLRGPVPAADTSTAPDEDAPAYVYFTSGSTGEPKGVAGRLPSLASRIAWEIDAFGISAGCRVSQLVSPTFDAWLRDVFVPLCVGGTICVPPERPDRTAPEDLVAWLEAAAVHLVHCVPTLLGAIVSAPARVRRLPALRAVLLSGEALHVSLVRRWRRRFGRQAAIANLYGATEATMIQFCHVVEERDLQRDFIPVGRPLPDVTVRLVDETGAPCAAGGVGEIWVGGPDLSLGYLGDERATREAFVTLPGGDGRTACRFYRTGDLGVDLGDGTYRLIGRRDQQVKIRGVRIDPREVEDALTGYPLVASCAVAAVSGQDGEPALVAYVVPETEHPPAVPEMRAFLRERLPARLIPARFVQLDRLPLTATGKVDRLALPAPDWSQAQADHPAVPPRSADEKRLVQLWRELLSLDRIGVHDHLIDLGGHSLTAMRLVTRIRESFHVELSVRDVLDHPTIAALAARIEAARRGSTDRPRGREARMPGTRASPLRSTPTPAAAPADAPAAGPPGDVEFECPSTPSPWFGARACNLVLLLGGGEERESFDRLARLVEELDPTVHTEVLADAPGWRTTLAPRPTLFFAQSLLRHPPLSPGRVCCGYPLAKSEEYRALEAAGIPVPRWVALREGETPDLSGFGAYVVRKPDQGGKGAQVRIVRRDRARWKAIVTSTAGPSPTLLVQEFVYTGPWPVSYRVNTLFARVLYAMRLTANTRRRALPGPESFAEVEHGDAVSIVSNARDSTAEFCRDPEIILMGERAAAAFPEHPVLGVDILRDAATGRLFVIEVNALGHNWNFTQEFRAAFGLDPDRQFGGLRKAAYLLAEQTQRLASRDPPPAREFLPPS